MSQSRSDILIATLPWIWLALGSAICFVLGATGVDATGKRARQIALGTCLVAIVSAFAEFYRERGSATGVYVAVGGTGSRVAPGTLIVDVFSLSVVVVSALVAVVALVLMHGGARLHGRTAHVCALILAAIGFADFLAAQNDIASLICATAGLTISLSALVACLKTEHQAVESALKTILASLFMGGLLCLGLAILYGTTGSTHLTDVGTSRVLMAIGATLVICTLAALTGALPLPQFVTTLTVGVPTPISGFAIAVLTLGVESAAVRVGAGGFGSNISGWTGVTGLMGALTMIYGGLRAWRETTLRGLVGYLVVVQAGAFLVALMSYGPGTDSLSAGGANLAIAAELTGSVAIVSAYAAVGALEHHKIGSSIGDLKALFTRNGVLAVALMLGVGALAGVPVTFGFITRALSVTSASYVDQLGVGLLAIVGMVLANVAAFRVFAALAAPPTHESTRIKTNLGWPPRTLIPVCSVAAIALVAFAGPILRLSSAAASAVFTH
jgi:NADH-quinone oxidoreductase subunit N